jgi:hypothetical protein
LTAGSGFKGGFVMLPGPAAAARVGSILRTAARAFLVGGQHRGERHRQRARKRQEQTETDQAMPDSLCQPAAPHHTACFLKVDIPRSSAGA